MKALRTLKGPRSVELSLCTQQGDWLVFSRSGGKAFEHGYAVRGGEVFEF